MESVAYSVLRAGATLVLNKKACFHSRCSIVLGCHTAV